MDCGAQELPHLRVGTGRSLHHTDCLSVVKAEGGGLSLIAKFNSGTDWTSNLSGLSTPCSFPRWPYGETRGDALREATPGMTELVLDDYLRKEELDREYKEANGISDDY